MSGPFKLGDRVRVVGGEFQGATGEVMAVAGDGFITVQFDGDREPTLLAARSPLLAAEPAAASPFKLGERVRVTEGRLRGEVGEVRHILAAGTAFVLLAPGVVKDEHGTPLTGAIVRLSKLERATGPVLCVRCTARPTRSCDDPACDASRPAPAAPQAAKRDPIEQAREEAHAAGWESRCTFGRTPDEPMDLELIRPGDLSVSLGAELDRDAGGLMWDLVVEGLAGGILLGNYATATEAIAEAERRLARIAQAVRGS